MPRDINWDDELPPCDFCGLQSITRPALYDGKTTQGPWANMCEPHLIEHGFPLSEGLTNKRVRTKA